MSCSPWLFMCLSLEFLGLSSSSPFHSTSHWALVLTLKSPLNNRFSSVSFRYPTSSNISDNFVATPLLYTDITFHFSVSNRSIVSMILIDLFRTSIFSIFLFIPINIPAYYASTSYVMYVTKKIFKRYSTNRDKWTKWNFQN